MTTEALALPPFGDITSVSLSLPADLPETQWVDMGKRLAPLAQASQWWVGDWILYGERLYGKRKAYELAQVATGYKRDTLYQYARLAERIEPVRRVQELPFSVHRAVECLPPENQTLFLTEAKLQGYGEEKLRELVKKVPEAAVLRPAKPQKQLDAAGRYRKLRSIAEKVYGNLPLKQRQAEIRQHTQRLVGELG